MKIIALLGIRNEELYLERCLQHLVKEGIEVVIIDNSSTDETLDIAQSWLGNGVVAIENFPYPGFFDWKGILEFKLELSKKYVADWYIHHDADEIRQSGREGESLSAAITRLDFEGFNSIDFMEFVFVPISKQQSFEKSDFVEQMDYAYYFQPRPFHQIKAWKQVKETVNIAKSGGHRAQFLGQKLADEKLILRHYPFLSWQHLMHKYKTRIYSQQEIKEYGWHGKRVNFDHLNAWLPSESQLIKPKIDGWNISKPRKSHPYLAGDWDE